MLLVALLAACNSGGSPTEPNVAFSDSEIEFKLLQLTNQARQSSNVEPLGLESGLSDIARQHSRDMRDLGFLGHVKPDGTTLRQRLEAAGYEFSRAAENIAQVTRVGDPASFAHDLLMESERHRANILDPRFSLVGIGVARSNDTFWITQVFLRP